MMKYLVNFSYIGTRFRGSQTQLLPGSSLKDFDDRATVQGLFNIAFRRIKPANDPVFTLSSRTDAGVHALGNAGHVQLLHPYHEQGRTYSCTGLAKRLNRFFNAEAVDIWVHGLQPVPASFHARHDACQRCYLYRLAVLPTQDYLHGLLPVTERHRCGVVRQPFSEEILRECARLLSGTHDFRSFMGTSKSEKPDVRTVRQLELEVCPGVSLASPSYLHLWHLHFRSRGFLYRQVRRTVGVLAAAACGRISLDEVRHMLENPSKDSWIGRVSVARAEGLYLQEVRYPAELLRCDQAEGEPGGATVAPHTRPTESRPDS